MGWQTWSSSHKDQKDNSIPRMEYVLFVLGDMDRQQLSRIKLLNETVRVWLYGFLLAIALLTLV